MLRRLSELVVAVGRGYLCLELWKEEVIYIGDMASYFLLGFAASLILARILFVWEMFTKVAVTKT